MLKLFTPLEIFLLLILYSEFSNICKLIKVIKEYTKNL
jgi:hypothetical protein